MVRAIRLLAVAVLAVGLGCGDSDDSSSSSGGSGNPAQGASQRDVCDALAQCIFGASDPDGDALSDQCVADGFYSAGSSTCLNCVLDLSCANLELALEGDVAAQAMCPTCE
jgi:hypothetical protein